MSRSIESPDDPLLPPAVVAEEFGLAEQTLANWRSTQRYALPFIRVGRMIRYRRSAVEKFLASRTAGATP